MKPSKGKAAVDSWLDIGLPLVLSTQPLIKIHRRIKDLYEVEGAHALGDCDIEILEWQNLFPHVPSYMLESSYARVDSTSTTDPLI